MIPNSIDESNFIRILGGVRHKKSDNSFLQMTVETRDVFDFRLILMRLHQANLGVTQLQLLPQEALEIGMFLVTHGAKAQALNELVDFEKFGKSPFLKADISNKVFRSHILKEA